jgi:hypothetical protein
MDCGQIVHPAAKPEYRILAVHSQRGSETRDTGSLYLGPATTLPGENDDSTD